MLVQRLHVLYDGATRTAPLERARCPTLFALTLVALGGTGCVPPPVEPEPQEINMHPIIDPDALKPEERQLQVQRGTDVELSSGILLDPNPEDELYYVWRGARTGLQGLPSTAQQIGTPRPDEGQPYYEFESVSRNFSSCSIDLQNVDLETFTLYVSDRPFVEETGTGLVIPPDGRLATRSWTILFDGSC